MPSQVLTTSPDDRKEIARSVVREDVTVLGEVSGAAWTSTETDVTSTETDVTFVTAALGAESGHLVGEFNAWSTDATPMELANGTFRVTIPLRSANSYRYHISLDGDRWQDDLHADDYVHNQRGGHDSVRHL